MSPETERLLHRMADAQRAWDAYPKGRGDTSEVAVRTFYVDTVKRLAAALIEEGYGK